MNILNSYTFTNIYILETAFTKKQTHLLHLSFNILILVVTLLLQGATAPHLKDVSGSDISGSHLCLTVTSASSDNGTWDAETKCWKQQSDSHSVG